MAVNHPQNVLDDIALLRRRIRDLEGSRTLGAQLAPCTSTTHPANPAIGREIVETDTGLRAWWNGSAWVYPPQRIASQTLAGAASTVTFSNIPQGFSNLRLEICARSTGTTSTGWDAAGIQLNGVTSNYNWNSFYTTQGASAVSVAGATSATNAQIAEVWNSFFSGTGGRGVTTVRIPSYSTSGNLKVMRSESAASDGGSAGILQTYTGTLGGSGNTGAVTSLKLLMGIGSFVAGSTFNLFGE